MFSAPASTPLASSERELTVRAVVTGAVLGGVLSLTSGLSTIGMAHLAGMALRRVPGRTRLLLLMDWMSIAAAQWLLAKT